MKTSRIIFMLALAAAATACNKAELEDTDPVVLKSNQFLASLEGATTKVTMAGNFTLSWVKGDQVSVFDEEGSNLVFTAAADGASVTLEGDDVVVDAAKTYYAIYPYSDGNSIENGVITTVIPTVQTPKKGDIPVNFAVAKNDERTFSFYNVCGLVGFEITESDIVSVTVKANGTDEYLTGKVKVTPSAAPSYEVVEGVSEVTLVAEGKAFEAGYHYVAVLPQAFENGITVLMTKADGTVASKTTTKAFTLSRSHRIDTKQIDASQSWTKLTSISNAAELQGFLAAAGSYTEDDVVTLADDIDLSGYDIVPAASFAGTFDGADKSITNWNTTTALFNEVTGTVKNLNIAESCNLEVQVKGDAAFIVLANAGTISGCKNYGTVTSVKDPFMQEVESTHNDRMTGTIAAVSTGVVKDCENHGIIKITPNSIGKYTRQYVGGVVGQFKASAGVVAVENCTNNASVSIEVVAQHSGKLFVGGVCGGTPAGEKEAFEDYGIMQNCINQSAVTISANSTSGSNNHVNVGGVVGYVEADLDNCDNSGAISVIYPFNAESVPTTSYAKRPAVGGVAGTLVYNAENCDNSASGKITVKGCFGAGTKNEAGAGINVGAAIGGIFGFVGNDNVANNVTTCTNAGDVDLQMAAVGDLNLYTGGVCGLADAKFERCTNTGKLTYDCDTNDACYGGIAGATRGTDATLTNGYVTYCTNSGEILANNVGAGNFRIGGVCGFHNLDQAVEGNNTAYNLSFMHNSNEGNISVLKATNTNANYVGGITGQTLSRIAGESSTNRGQNTGDIYVDCRARVIVGGITGRTGQTLIDMNSYADITVINPVGGSGAWVGGVCGMKTDNKNDARTNFRGNIVVTESEGEEVYAGMLYGRSGGTFTTHSSVINGNISGEGLKGTGYLVGTLYSGTLKLGNDNKITLRPTCELNGEALLESDVTPSEDILLGHKRSGTLSIVNVVVVPMN